MIKAGAREYNERFLDLWKNADPAVHIYNERGNQSVAKSTSVLLPSLPISIQLPLWASGTNGKADVWETIMQGDGNDLR